VLLKKRHAYDAATKLYSREACCYPDNLNRVASPLVERLIPDQELIPVRTEVGALTESGRLQYMISFISILVSVKFLFKFLHIAFSAVNSALCTVTVLNSTEIEPRFVAIFARPFRRANNHPDMISSGIELDFIYTSCKQQHPEKSLERPTTPTPPLNPTHRFRFACELLCILRTRIQ
jgi:hypothetical protein